jgi:hypothetical protein
MPIDYRLLARFSTMTKFGPKMRDKAQSSPEQ